MIVLDTHALVWAVTDSPRIGPAARARIDDERRAGRVGVSAITPWEIALLVAKGRLRLSMDVGVWIDRTLGSPGIDLCPIEPVIALDSVRLPGEFHADPADRFLIATARHWTAALVTADAAILEYSAAGHVTTIDAGR